MRRQLAQLFFDFLAVDSLYFSHLLVNLILNLCEVFVGLLHRCLLF